MRNIMENGMEFYAFKFKDVLLIINSRPLVFPLVFSLSFSFVFGVRFIWGGRNDKKKSNFYYMHIDVIAISHRIVESFIISIVFYLDCTGSYSQIHLCHNNT